MARARGGGWRGNLFSETMNALSTALSSPYFWGIAGLLVATTLLDENDPGFQKILVIAAVTGGVIVAVKVHQKSA
jgi:hypothetical protein